eukprot:gene6650-10815_t
MSTKIFIFFFLQLLIATSYAALFQHILQSLGTGCSTSQLEYQIIHEQPQRCYQRDCFNMGSVSSKTVCSGSTKIVVPGKYWAAGNFKASNCAMGSLRTLKIDRMGICRKLRNGGYGKSDCDKDYLYEYQYHDENCKNQNGEPRRFKQIDCQFGNRAWCSHK